MARSGPEAQAQMKTAVEASNLLELSKEFLSDKQSEAIKWGGDFIRFGFLKGHAGSSVGMARKGQGWRYRDKR